MKVRLLFSALLALGLAAPAVAQEKDFSIGPRIGAGMSKLSYSEGGDGEKFSFAFNAGVAAVYRPGKSTLAFAPALHFNSLSSRSEATSDLSSTTRFNNIGLDLAGRIYFTKGDVAPYALVGIRNNFRMGVGVTYSDELKKFFDDMAAMDPDMGLPSGSEMEKASEEAIKEGTQTYTLSGIVGLGVQINQFYVEGEFSPGITKLNKEGDGSIRLNSFGLNVGILF